MKPVDISENDADAFDLWLSHHFAGQRRAARCLSAKVKLVNDMRFARAPVPPGTMEALNDAWEAALAEVIHDPAFRRRFREEFRRLKVKRRIPLW